MAEGIFRHKVQQLGLSGDWGYDSAGTAAYHIGEPPDPRTMETLARHQIAFQHYARQVMPADAERFDYILAMDSQNLRDLRDILPPGYDGLYKMRDFDPRDPGADVPDPYYGGRDGFEKVYQMLDRSIDHFISQIRDSQSAGR